ncbi:glutathione binding-like protein [Variovorax rhizosphaerae]|uniref:Glutathione binding-like protein n=1 Tax=Variovorax rhizosphaerae TaxID=1836200 RepID=A0ABU8WVR4_9BURK
MQQLLAQACDERSAVPRLDVHDLDLGALAQVQQAPAAVGMGTHQRMRFEGRQRHDVRRASSNRAPLFYLAEKEGRFWPRQDLHARYEVVQWVIWQMANQGPKFGERGHFSRVPESAGDQAYAQRRFNDEVHRLYGVLNNRLHDRRHIAGDEYTIADIAAYPWTVSWQLQGIDLNEFRYFKRWFEEISARPAVQRGLAVTAGPPEDPASVTPEEQARRRKILYNQRARPAPVAS